MNVKKIVEAIAKIHYKMGLLPKEDFSCELSQLFEMLKKEDIEIYLKVVPVFIDIASCARHIEDLNMFSDGEEVVIRDYMNVFEK